MQKRVHNYVFAWWCDVLFDTRARTPSHSVQAHTRTQTHEHTQHAKRFHFQESVHTHVGDISAFYERERQRAEHEAQYFDCDALFFSLSLIRFRWCRKSFLNCARAQTNFQSPDAYRCMCRYRVYSVSSVKHINQTILFCRGGFLSHTSYTSLCLSRLSEGFLFVRHSLTHVYVSVCMSEYACAVRIYATWSIRVCM